MTQWKHIPGHPGYQASDDGQIRSLTRQQQRGAKTYTIRGGVLSQSLSEGYYRVLLGRGVYAQVHRLICLAFHGEPTEGKPWALHDDGDNLHNAAGNLYWGSPLENSADRRRHGKDHGWDHPAKGKKRA